MNLRLGSFFDAATLQRGRDYARRGLVVAVEPLSGGGLRGQVSNGRGQTYQQRIVLERGIVDGTCSCPVGYNCKHVAAVLLTWAARADRQTDNAPDSTSGSPPALAAPVQGWLARVRDSARRVEAPRPRPQDYPDAIKDRLLYVLIPNEPMVRVDIFKGRVNAAGTGLNKAIRRYDALLALRSAQPAGFIRPVDLELLPALAQARLWETRYGHGLPELFRFRGAEATALIRRLCDTGRFFHDNAPDAHLAWSETSPEARLGWRMASDGSQRLGFADDTDCPLTLRGLEGATLWVDTAQGLIGALAEPVATEVLRLVAASPDVAPDQAAALAHALPDRLAGLALPRPRVPRQTRRAARRQVA
ncbi:MAG: SWIM zinc finger family protein, partial [Pararhodobacter sp.]|nr:SWIM zinc finger family protein [Pararhodobacter sp.]